MRQRAKVPPKPKPTRKSSTPQHFLIPYTFNLVFRTEMPELAEVVDGQAEEVDEGVGDEVHSEESGDDNDSIPDLEETEAAAGGEVAASLGTVHFQKRDTNGYIKFSGKRMYVDIVHFQKKRCRNKTFQKGGVS